MKLDTYIKKLQKLRKKYGNINLVHSIICFTSGNGALIYFPLSDDYYRY